MTIEHLKWYKISEDGLPPTHLKEDEQLIVSDAQGEIRPAFYAGKSFIGYIVEPVQYWMVIAKPKELEEQNLKMTTE